MSLAAPSPPLRELTRRQWQWIAGGFTGAFASMGGQTVFIAVFGAQIRGEFGLSAGEYGFLYTIATLGSAICLVWAGTLADKFSPRLLLPITVGGLGLTAFGMTQVNSIFALGFAIFALRFFGQGMTAHVAATTMTRWFNRFRGRALAMAQLGFSTGEATLPFLLALGIVALGWRNVWLVAGLVLIVVFIPLLLWLFSDEPDGKRAKARGDINPDAADTGAPTGAQWTRGQVLRDPLFWPVLTGVVAMPALSTAIFFHQSSLVVSKGWSLLLFTGSIPVMSGVAVVSGLIAGSLIDRYGAHRLLPFLLVPFSLACLVLWATDHPASIPVFFALAGASGGMVGSTMNALWAEVYGTAHLGAIRALATSAMVLASALGPGIVGVLMDAGTTLPQQGPGFAIYCIAVSGVYLALGPRLAARVKSIRG
ncbi:MFS transporter [Cucumibacter marinus]|uniref:MFS transporter n=1 Tax=Cucumibacter marinus TaxID=1121252 RepID=UPI0003FB5101|nr:MFS transporter [Cucumibacter marinus]